jgi:hypothetical protein
VQKAARTDYIKCSGLTRKTKLAHALTKHSDTGRPSGRSFVVLGHVLVEFLSHR